MDFLELDPLSPMEEAIRLVKLAGEDNILQNAQQALDTDDPQWALRLTSALLRYRYILLFYNYRD